MTIFPRTLNPSLINNVYYIICVGCGQITPSYLRNFGRSAFNFIFRPTRFKAVIWPCDVTYYWLKTSSLKIIFLHPSPPYPLGKPSSRQMLGISINFDETETLAGCQKLIYGEENKSFADFKWTWMECDTRQFCLKRLELGGCGWDVMVWREMWLGARASNCIFNRGPPDFGLIIPSTAVFVCRLIELTANTHRFIYCVLPHLILLGPRRATTTAATTTGTGQSTSSRSNHSTQLHVYVHPWLTIKAK